MGEIKNTHRMLAGNPKRKISLVNLRRKWGAILKWILKYGVQRYVLDSSGSG
jgi:hypothetical protein